MTQQAQTDLFDEPGALKGLQRDAQTLAKQFEPLAKLKPGDADALEVLEKALKALPTGQQIGVAVDELRSRGSAALAAARSTRADSFGRLEAEFIRHQRESGALLRESGNSSWRVGPVELELQRESSRARVLYNREAITAWKAVGSREDLERLLSGAIKNLESASLPESELPEVLWDAYEHLRRTHTRSDAGHVRVPLLDLFREVRVVLARHELRSGKPDRKLTRTDLPRWAFLYNLDRYRRMLPNLPADRRLSLETGSQHDHQKGRAMVVNGLDPNEDYKPYCYAYAAPAGSV